MSARILPFFTKPDHATERAFLPAALEVVETPASPTLRVTALLISVFLTAAVIWSYIGKIDIFAVAPGKLTLRDSTKIEQAAFAGQVKEIDVSGGQYVKPGQALIKLDPTIPEADEKRYKEELLMAGLDSARLRAELSSIAVAEPFADVKAPPDLLAMAEGRFEAEEDAQKEMLADIDQQIAQKRSEVAEVGAQIDRIDAKLPLVKRRIHIRSVGAKGGYGSLIDYLKVEQEGVDLIGERLVESRKRDAIDATLKALTYERARAVSDFRKSALADLAKASKVQNNARDQLTKARKEASLTKIAAPVAGFVQDLSVDTKGAVVAPGQKLLRIVPATGRMEVKAVIANQDVGFVKVGQPAEVKIQSFPFTQYGLLHGTVREISHDSVQERPSAQSQDNSQSAGDTPNSLGHPDQLVYVARISLPRQYMDIDGKKVTLLPGMAVTAEIKTGRRRVLDYLLSPFRRYEHDALRER